MTFGAFCEKKASAAGDLETFVNELVLIGVGEEAQVDARAPDGFAVVGADDVSGAKGGFVGVGVHGAGPMRGAGGDGDGDSLAPQLSEGFAALVIGCANEGDVAIAVDV